MNKVQCNGVDFTFNTDYLPLLIHGEDKAGASMFTITVVASFFEQGEKIIFLCGYPMAKEAFTKQVGQVSDDKVLFFTKEEVSKFIQTISTIPDINERLILIKNIDLFTEEIFDAISHNRKIIISGDVNKCAFKEKLLSLGYKSKVLFSPLEGNQIPYLEKYQGFLISKDTSGIVNTLI